MKRFRDFQHPLKRMFIIGVLPLSLKPTASIKLLLHPKNNSVFTGLPLS